MAKLTHFQDLLIVDWIVLLMNEIDETVFQEDFSHFLFLFFFDFVMIHYNRRQYVYLHQHHVWSTVSLSSNHCKRQRCVMVFLLRKKKRIPNNAYWRQYFTDQSLSVPQNVVHVELPSVLTNSCDSLRNYCSMIVCHLFLLHFYTSQLKCVEYHDYWPPLAARKHRVELHWEF